MRKAISYLGRILFLVVVRRRLRSSGCTASWKKNSFPTSWGGLDVSWVSTLLTAELPIEYLWSTVEIPLTDTKSVFLFY